MSSHIVVDPEAYFLRRPSTLFSGSNVAVSTLTPLTSWVLLIDFAKVLFVMQNLDATNNVSLIVETSEDQVHPDAEFWRATAPAGEQVSYEVGLKETRQYFRMSAVTDAPTFPAVNVNWQLRVLPLR